MKILISLCARGGSKGIPGKNIKPIAGKPLLAYSIEIAQKFAAKHECIISLSTDDEAIKNTAKAFGLYTDYERPAIMATDTAGKLPAIIDLKNYEEKKHNIAFDYVLDLDITSPLRTLDDLENALKLIEADDQALNLFSVNIANRNPYFNMVEKKENGYYGLIKALPNGVLSRQAAPKVYDLNASFYFYKKNFFDLNFYTAISTHCLIYEMPHICFDLDHIIDFEFMEYLILNNKLDFDL